MLDIVHSYYLIKILYKGSINERITPRIVKRAYVPATVSINFLISFFVRLLKNLKKSPIPLKVELWQEQSHFLCPSSKLFPKSSRSLYIRSDGSIYRDT